MRIHNDYHALAKHNHQGAEWFKEEQTLHFGNKEKANSFPFKLTA